MIQHVRVRRVAVPQNMFRSLVPRLRCISTSAVESEQADETLDVLLKHAFKSAPEEQENDHIWQRLARKMIGPFGAPALEGPAMSNLEIELDSSGGWSRSAPFALRIQDKPHHGSSTPGHESLWSLLRFDQLGLPQRGCNSLLA